MESGFDTCTGEKILWRGCPERRYSILRAILNEMFFALLIMIALIFVIFYLIGRIILPWQIAIVAFSLPLIIYLGILAKRLLEGRHVSYTVTEGGILSTEGVFSIKEHNIPFQKFLRLKVRKGFYGWLTGIWEIIIYSKEMVWIDSGDDGGGHFDNDTIVIRGVYDYLEVAETIKRAYGDYCRSTYYESEEDQ